MRNVCTLLLILVILAACSEDEEVKLEGADDFIFGVEQVDSLNFTCTHFYWKGHQFVVADSLNLTSTLPSSEWQADSICIYKEQVIVVADIRRHPSSPDSIWLRMVTINDTLPSQGWISENQLLCHTYPLNKFARSLSFLGPLADVPGGKYPSYWNEFYFQPTANPLLLSLPMAIVVILLWVLLLVILASVDRLLFDRQRYRCGCCHAPIRHLGICPHCGAENKVKVSKCANLD